MRSLAVLFCALMLGATAAADADSLTNLRRPSSTVPGCVNHWGPLGTRIAADGTAGAHSPLTQSRADTRRGPPASSPLSPTFGVAVILVIVAFHPSPTGSAPRVPWASCYCCWVFGDRAAHPQPEAGALPRQNVRNEFLFPRFLNS